jgi:hypothetical protein
MVRELDVEVVLAGCAAWYIGSAPPSAVTQDIADDRGADVLSTLLLRLLLPAAPGRGRHGPTTIGAPPRDGTGLRDPQPSLATVVTLDVRRRSLAFGRLPWIPLNGADRANPS